MLCVGRWKTERRAKSGEKLWETRGYTCEDKDEDDDDEKKTFAGVNGMNYDFFFVLSTYFLAELNVEC